MSDDLSKYDYPSDVTEGISEVGHQAASAWNTFANKNLKVGCPCNEISV